MTNKIRLGAGLAAALSTPLAQAHHELEQAAVQAPGVGTLAVAAVAATLVLLVCMLRRRPNFKGEKQQ